MATMEAPPRLQVRLHEGAFKNESFVDFSKEDNVRKMAGGPGLGICEDLRVRRTFYQTL